MSLFLYFYFLERGKGRETERERNNDWLHLVRAPTEHRTHNPGMWPDWEWNWWPFTSWDDAQQTEPPQLGLVWPLFQFMLDAWARLSLKLKKCLTTLWPLPQTNPWLKACSPCIDFFLPMDTKYLSACCLSVVFILISNLSLSALFNHERFHFFLYLVFESSLL